MSLRFMRRKQYVPVSVPVVCLPMVQCSPFQPSLHSHFPSLQVPCSVQRGWHTRWSQPAPVQPSSQRQAPPMHTPWVPQSTEHTSRRENSSHSQPQGQTEHDSNAAALNYSLSKAGLLTRSWKLAFKWFWCLKILAVLFFKSCSALVRKSKLHIKC